MPLRLKQKEGRMDYENLDGFTHQDVAPAFKVIKIISHLDVKESDYLQIKVNDHNVKQYEFEIDSSLIYETQSLMQEFAKNKVLFPSWVGIIDLSNYLFEGYKCCKNGGKFEYTHTSLGWFEYEGIDLFLSAETEVNGFKSICEREKFSFSGGSKAIYEKFLKDEIYTVPTLSLAMSIGYSAVVSSRLKDMADVGTIIVNLCGASSTGKTTVEHLMVSPFGSPKISNNSGLIRNFTSTQNARFAGLEGINGVPMVLDDATTAEYLNAKSLIYTIARWRSERQV